MSNTLWLVVVGSAVVVGFLAKHYHAKITGFFLTLKADIARVETMLGAHHDAVAQEVNAATTKPAQVQQTFMGMPLREPISNSGFASPPPLAAPQEDPVAVLREQLLDASTSSDPKILAASLNLGGQVMARALVRLTAFEATNEHGLGLLYDGTINAKYATADFYNSLNSDAQKVLRDTIAAQPGTEQLLARLGCNPDLAYLGNDTFTVTSSKQGL